jgi:hypothetical protein
VHLDDSVFRDLTDRNFSALGCGTIDSKKRTGEILMSNKPSRRDFLAGTTGLLRRGFWDPHPSLK